MPIFGNFIYGMFFIVDNFVDTSETHLECDTIGFEVSHSISEFAKSPIATKNLSRIYFSCVDSDSGHS